MFPAGRPKLTGQKLPGEARTVFGHITNILNSINYHKWPRRHETGKGIAGKQAEAEYHAPRSFYFRLAAFILGAGLVAAPAPVLAFSRVKDLVDVEGIRDNMLVGYGLVVGLNGTGD